MGQGVVHIVWNHLVQGGIPDSVLFGEQVCQELCRRKESNETEDEVVWTFPDLKEKPGIFIPKPQFHVSMFTVIGVKTKRCFPVGIYSMSPHTYNNILSIVFVKNKTKQTKIYFRCFGLCSTTVSFIDMSG